MKTLKFLSLMIAFVCALGFTSCSSDDDEDVKLEGYHDFYIDVTVSCNGWDAIEIAEYEAGLKGELLSVAYSLKKITLEDAKEIFKKFVDDLAYDFEDYEVTEGGPLYMNFYLKTQDNGTTVASRTIEVKSAK